MLSNRKKKLSFKHIFLVIIFVIIILIIIFSLFLDEKRNLNRGESLIKDSISYVQKVVYIPFNYLFSAVSDIKELRKVKEENEILKKNINKIEAVQAENEELRREINSLKEELDIDYVLTDYEQLNATIISRNVGYWYNTLIIDKGSYNGIKKDMIVVNSYGLVGRIVKTTAFTSTVKLITTSDTNNKISVTVTNGEDKINGLINRYDYNEKILEIEGISNTEDVSIGDYVYTSGLGGIFPSGVLIGKVESITTDEYDLSKIIKVTPSVNFDDLNYVTILKRKDKQE